MTVTRQTNFKHSPNFRKHSWLMMPADSAVASYPSVFVSTPRPPSPTPKPKKAKKKKVKAKPPVKQKNKATKQNQPPKIKHPPRPRPVKPKEDPVLQNPTGGMQDIFMIDFLNNFNRLKLERGMTQTLSCYFPTWGRTYLNCEILNLQKQVFLAQRLKVRFTVETVQNDIITAIKFQVE